MEIELMYQRLLDMANNGKVFIKNELADSLRNESNKLDEMIQL